MQSSKTSPITFNSSVIQPGREDGYWVETYKFSAQDKVPGVIASGLVSGRVEYLENPLLTGGDITAPWKSYSIGQFDSPVAVCAVDVNRNGLTDVIICHKYGPFMLECDTEGGFITWLENPGKENLGKGPWKQHYIGRWPAMHRIKAGHFTQKSYLEVVAASVVCGPHDKTTPIPIIKFTAPDNLMTAAEWHHEVIDDENFTVIHEVALAKMQTPDGLDGMLIASREGLTRLFYQDAEWHREVLSVGVPKEARQSPTSESPGSGDHWGVGCVDAGKVNGDPFAYIATLEPFHGTTVCVYTRDQRGFENNTWKRHILDVFGTPNQLLHTGDGPGHYIACADFDGDGNDEFLLALLGPLDRDDQGEAKIATSGPNPAKGVIMYKAVDLNKGIWTKKKVVDTSAARLALGNFGGNGVSDFVSISYNVKRYYEEPNPEVSLHLLQQSQPQGQRFTQFVATPWDNESIVYVPQPQVCTDETFDVINVAGYKMSLRVLPPNATFDTYEKANKGIPVGIKVLYGAISIQGNVIGPCSVPEFTTSTIVPANGEYQAGATTGAVILILEQEQTFGTMTGGSEVAISLALPDAHRFTQPAFVPVNSLWWGKGFPERFWNASGVYLRFQDQTPLAHLQFWVAGQGVNCGVHKHTDAIFQEIHVGLINQTGDGGMARLKAEDATLPAEEIVKLDDSHFDRLPVQAFEEHGPLWERDTYGKAVRGRNNVVKYPWHKWQSGKKEGVDVWMAIEFNPDL